MSSASESFEIKLVQYHDDRFYKIVRQFGEEERTDYYPSVTTKLGIVQPSFLARWRGDIGNREADARLFESQERGKRIHKAFELMLSGVPVAYANWQDPDREARIKELEDHFGGPVHIVKYQDEMLDVWKLHQFVDIVKPGVLRTETTVINDEWKEAGTVDAVFAVEEGEYPVNGRNPIPLEKGIYVADLKSGKSIDQKAKYQTAAYLHMVEKMYSIECAGTLILHTQSKNRAGVEGLGVKLSNRKQVDQEYQAYRNIAAVWDQENTDIQPVTLDFPDVLIFNPKEKKEKADELPKS